MVSRLLLIAISTSGLLPILADQFRGLDVSRIQKGLFDSKSYESMQSTQHKMSRQSYDAPQLPQNARPWVLDHAVPEHGRVVDLIPIRMLFFRHGLSCANIYKKACRPGMQELSEGEIEQLFDAFEKVGKEGAPDPLPPLDRKFGIRMHGEKYRGADGNEKKGDDCTVQMMEGVPGEYSPKGSILATRHLYQDPMLTNCSAYQSHRAGQALRKYLAENNMRLDFLGASTLMRTFETAYSELIRDAEESWSSVFSSEIQKRFPYIYQLPWGNERDGEASYEINNFPYDPKIQNGMMGDKYGKAAMRHLNTSFLEYPEAQEGRVAFNWPRFMEFMVKRVVPRVLREKGEPLPAFDSPLPEDKEKRKHWYRVNDETGGFNVDSWPWGNELRAKMTRRGKIARTVRTPLNLAVASHSGFIRRLCQHSDKVRNNALVERLFVLEVSSDGSMFIREQEGECKVLIDTPDMTPWSTADVGNCRPPIGSFDHARMLVLDEGSVGEDGKTACMAAADKRDAYVTMPATGVACSRELARQPFGITLGSMDLPCCHFECTETWLPAQSLPPSALTGIGGFLLGFLLSQMLKQKARQTSEDDEKKLARQDSQTEMTATAPSSAGAGTR